MVAARQRKPVGPRRGVPALARRAAADGAVHLSQDRRPLRERQPGSCARRCHGRRVDRERHPDRTSPDGHGEPSRVRCVGRYEVPAPVGLLRLAASRLRRPGQPLHRSRRAPGPRRVTRGARTDPLRLAGPERLPGRGGRLVEHRRVAQPVEPRRRRPRQRLRHRQLRRRRRAGESPGSDGVGDLRRGGAAGVARTGHQRGPMGPRQPDGMVRHRHPHRFRDRGCAARHRHRPVGVRRRPVPLGTRTR